MKKWYLLFFFFMVSMLVFAQTTLTPGDIAIIGANCYDPDDFAFLLLKPIDAGTVIHFTDNGWTASGGFRGGEGTLTFTAGQNYTAGTVVVYSQHNSEFTVSGSGSFALSTSGDQILAYQGDVTNPSFIFALNIKGTHVWQDDATSSNTSALPTGLTNGSTAVAVDEFDNVKYNGPVNFPDPQSALQAIGDYQNWIGDDVNRFDFAAFSDFSLPVQLVYFRAFVRNGDVELQWKTASETENAGFEIYRSSGDENDYQLIAGYQFIPSLRGGGNSSESRDYVFIDDNVVKGQVYFYRLVAVDLQGRKEIYSTLSVQVVNGSIAEPLTGIPAQFVLEQNYPNPFNPVTTIRFSTPSPGGEKMTVSLRIYDMTGKLIKTLFHAPVEGGMKFSVVWDGTDEKGQPVSSGIYFARMETSKYIKTIKMMLMK